MQKNPYPLRIDDIVMEKTKYIAKENGRSINKEIEMVLKKIVADYEKEHGDIVIPE
jgi:hypothetical protein